MTRVALTGGYYVAPNLIANSQRCLNLYAEPNPPDSPVPFTDYPAPGSRILGTYAGGPIRGAYTATNNQLFIVAGLKVYYVDQTWAGKLIGTLISNPRTIVSMADNGTTLLMVDGSSNGYTIDLATHAFAPLVEDAFFGAVRVDFLSTYFLLNKPFSGEFYALDSNAVTADPLWFAFKVTYADDLATLIVLGQDFYLLGTQQSTEVWVLNDNPDFPFQRLPAVLINHGCVAAYSVAKIGTQIFWLSRDLNGQGVVLKGANYEGIRISTFAIEAAIHSYATIEDAIGCCYQQRGHQFYVLTFPSADKTWVFDVQSGQWHERCWIDGEGVEHRVRGQVMAFAYGQNVAGDWQTGTLRTLDDTLDTDDGVAMKFLRGFPHMLQDGDRVFFRQFIADMSVGAGIGTLSIVTALNMLAPDGYPSGVFGIDGSPGFILGTDPAAVVIRDPPFVSLRWSDTRGVTWSNPLRGSMGKIGEFLTQIQFQRLGMARDRVFELFWSGNGGCAALNGAFVETTKAGT